MAVLLALGMIGGAINLPRIAPKTRAVESGSRSTTVPASLRHTLLSRFGLFLGCWFFAMLGLMTFYNVVPLLLKDSFGTDARTSSLVFLVGSAIGAILYPVSGRLSRRLGSARVLAVGLAVTLLAFLVLSLATFDHGTLGGLLGSGCLIVIAAVYPFSTSAPPSSRRRSHRAAKARRWACSTAGWPPARSSAPWSRPCWPVRPATARWHGSRSAL